MKYVIIVNGRPLSGKSTFNRFCQNYINDCEIGNAHIHSAVEKIYEIYRELGWDGKKTDQFRNDMAALKQMYIRNCNGPIRDIVRLVLEADDVYLDQYFFVDCREPDQIDQMVKAFDALKFFNIECITVYITDHGLDRVKYGNAADNNSPTDYPYQYQINNKKTDGIDALKTMCQDFINKISEVNTDGQE